MNAADRQILADLTLDILNEERQRNPQELFEAVSLAFHEKTGGSLDNGLREFLRWLIAEEGSAEKESGAGIDTQMNRSADR